MRREDVVRRALGVLHEVTTAAAAGPVTGTLGLRLALAYLYVEAAAAPWPHGRRREAFDRFWHVVREPGGGRPQDGYLRFTMARTYLQTIARQVGIGFTAEIDRSLAAMREAPPPPIEGPLDDWGTGSAREQRIARDVMRDALREFRRRQRGPATIDRPRP